MIITMINTMTSIMIMIRSISIIMTTVMIVSFLLFIMILIITMRFCSSLASPWRPQLPPEPQSPVSLPHCGSGLGNAKPRQGAVKIPMVFMQQRRGLKIFRFKAVFEGSSKPGCRNSVASKMVPSGECQPLNLDSIISLEHPNSRKAPARHLSS